MADQSVNECGQSASDEGALAAISSECVDGDILGRSGGSLHWASEIGC